MNLPAPPTGLYPEDYERIEAAVMETVRGRWFLLEYARRQRAEETERLIVAVDRLERVAARVEEQEAAADWRLPLRLVERAQEFSQTLRASGVDEALCAQADALVEQFSKLLDTPPAQRQERRVIAEAAPVEIIANQAEITAPAFTIESETAQEAVEVAQDEPPEEPETIYAELSEVEPFDAEPIEIEPSACEPVAFEPEPIASLEEEPHVEIMAAPAETPASNGIAFEEFVARAILPDEISPPQAAPARIVDPRLAALSRLDHLTLHEKLRLFG